MATVVTREGREGRPKHINNVHIDFVLELAVLGAAVIAYLAKAGPGIGAAVQKWA